MRHTKLINFTWMVFLLGLFFTLQPAQAQQVCNPNILASTPDSQLVDNGDGTITDTGPGLMWKKCLEGVSGQQCDSGSTLSLTWQQALERPGVVNSGGGYAGHTDWRLPNIKELVTIVEIACYNPSINTTVFPNTPSSFVWSGSAVAYGSDYAWYVNFEHGNANSNLRHNHRPVRLMRDGQ